MRKPEYCLTCTDAKSEVCALPGVTVRISSVAGKILAYMADGLAEARASDFGIVVTPDSTGSIALANGKSDGIYVAASACAILHYQNENPL